MTYYALHIGKRPTGVEVHPDHKWPDMWRIQFKDDISGMVNLTRAKDAAISWARPKGLGGKEVATWHRRETYPRGSPIRLNDGG